MVKHFKNTNLIIENNKNLETYLRF